MKKNVCIALKMTIQKTILLATAIFLNTGIGWSQITVTTSDMPSPGDTIRKSTALNTSQIDYTLTGANYTWDFASLFTVSQSVDTFVSVSSVPFLYQLIFIPNLIANLAQKYPEIDTIPEFQIVDPYRFFKNSSSSFNDVGFAFTINEIPFPLKYDTPDILYKFPMNYGNVDSSFSGIEFSVPDMAYIGIDRKRVNRVDGWGTLSTPYGTYNVLRLKSTVYESDTIYIDSIQFGTNINRQYTEYKWLSDNFGEPLLQVYEEGPLVTFTFIDSIRDPLLVVDPVLPGESGIVISPNPVHQNCNVEVNQTKSGDVRISLFNLTGIEVTAIHKGYLPIGMHRFSFDNSVQKLPKGLYIIQLKSDSQILSQKMIIQ